MNTAPVHFDMNVSITLPYHSNFFFGIELVGDRVVASPHRGCHFLHPSFILYPSHMPSPSELFPCCLCDRIFGILTPPANICLWFCLFVWLWAYFAPLLFQLQQFSVNLIWLKTTSHYSIASSMVVLKRWAWRFGSLVVITSPMIFELSSCCFLDSEIAHCCWCVPL